jgi:hypothetical protein
VNTDREIARVTGAAREPFADRLAITPVPAKANNLDFCIAFCQGVGASGGVVVRTIVDDPHVLDTRPQIIRKPVENRRKMAGGIECRNEY